MASDDEKVGARRRVDEDASGVPAVQELGGRLDPLLASHERGLA